MQSHKYVLPLFALCLSVCGSARAVDITWFGPTDAMNSNANWPAVNGTFSQNFGVAFQTGGSSSFTMDWVQLQLNTSSVTSGSGSLRIAIRNTTNSTAYSAVAGTTEYAVDTINFTMPTSSATAFTLNLTAADIPNVTSYAMASNSAYALILYAPSVNIGMQRRTGYANGTTNNFYTVSNGFVALDTFRNNAANYSNNASSFPSLGISFGETVVPEPSTWALGGLSALVLGFAARRKRA
jgi:hypothetical protein